MSTAAERIRNYLAERRTMGGIDHATINAINSGSAREQALHVSDIETVLSENAELLEAAKVAFYKEAGLTLAIAVQNNNWQWPPVSEGCPSHVSLTAESLRAAIAKATTP